VTRENCEVSGQHILFSEAINTSQMAPYYIRVWVYDFHYV